MQFTTTFTHATRPEDAIGQLAETLKKDGLSNLICYYSQEYSAKQIQQELRLHFPGIPFIGCSSCQAIMTDKGFHIGPVVALMAIYDCSYSAYGTGLVELGQEDDRQAAYVAIQQALRQANRIGEVPSLILLHSTPGHEEAFIDAIDATFGTHVPIIGGSAADNHIQKQWSIITQQGWSSNGIALQLFFPSKPLTSGFSAGYSPTEFEGEITQASHRCIQSIDGEPASAIYKEWISDHSNIQFNDRHLFEHVTRFPLGRVAGYVNQQPYYKLCHPIQILNDGSLELFATINEGEKIRLMTGSKEQLLNRASRVIQDANTQNYHESLLLGSIIIYCAGAMLRLGEDVQLVHKKLVEQMHGQPFICPFTFGEQGRFIGGENAHGNLMIASVIFYESE